MINRILFLTAAAILATSPALAAVGPAPEIDASIAGGVMLAVAAFFAARKRG